MKTTLSVVIIFLIVSLLLLASRYEFSTYTQYDSVAAKITGAAVSNDGDVLLTTNDSYLIVHPKNQWSHFSGPYAPSEVDDIITPKWSDFTIGKPPVDVSNHFHPEKIIAGWDANGISREEAHAHGEDTIVFRNEFASFRSPRAWLQLQLLSDNPKLESYSIRVFSLRFQQRANEVFFQNPRNS